MSEHLVAYVNWKRITAWKILSLSVSNKELVPFAYGSKQPIFKKYAQKDNIIWVFSIPMVESGTKKVTIKYRPTLVAKIVIDKVVNCSSDLKIFKNKKEIEKLICLWGNVALANLKESQFFELNDATDILLNLSFTGKGGTTSISSSFQKNQDDINSNKDQKLRVHIARNLRFIRHIDNKNSSCVNELTQFSKQIKKRSVFISYAFADTKVKSNETKEGRSLALALADELLGHEWSPWLDTLVINPRDGINKKTIPKDRLQKLLDFGIAGCPLFVAIISDNYLKDDKRKKIKWTLEELKTAKNKKDENIVNKIFQVNLCNKELPGFDFCFPFDNVKDLATQINDTYKKL